MLTKHILSYRGGRHLSKNTGRELSVSNGNIKKILNFFIAKMATSVVGQNNIQRFNLFNCIYFKFYVSGNAI